MGLTCGEVGFGHQSEVTGERVQLNNKPTLNKRVFTGICRLWIQELVGCIE